MKIIKGGLIYLAALCFVGSLTAVSPQEDLKTTISQVLKILDGKKSKKDKKHAIAQIYYAHFDLERMGANTLKSDYKTLSDEQRKEFSKKFGKFVLVFYLDKLDKYEKNKIQFIGDEIKGNRATVSTLLEYQGKMARVNYSMLQKGERWFVYDFEVEGVRLSSTYRSQFAKVLKEKGYEGIDRELDKLLAKYK